MGILCRAGRARCPNHPLSGYPGIGGKIRFYRKVVLQVEMKTSTRSELEKDSKDREKLVPVRDLEKTIGKPEECRFLVDRFNPFQIRPRGLAQRLSRSLEQDLACALEEPHLKGLKIAFESLDMLRILSCDDLSDFGISHSSCPAVFSGIDVCVSRWPDRKIGKTSTPLQHWISKDREKFIPGRHFEDTIHEHRDDRFILDRFDFFEKQP